MEQGWTVYRCYYPQPLRIIVTKITVLCWA
jgi:hypothetical protein